MSFSVPRVAPLADTAGSLALLRALVRNPVSAIPDSAYREPVFAPAIRNGRVIFVCAPDILEEILVARFADFPKSAVDELIFRPALGEGLLLAHGDAWRWKRRLAAPVFSPAALRKAFGHLVAPNLQDQLRRLRRDPGNEQLAVRSDLDLLLDRAAGRRIISPLRFHSLRHISSSMAHWSQRPLYGA